MDNQTKEKAYLVYSGQIFPLNKAVTKIGRQLDNDLVFQYPSISRYHAEIRIEEGKYCIYDLQSTSGTRVNNKEKTKYFLRSGDIIAMAQIAIMFIESRSELEGGSTLDTIELKPSNIE